jgi:hypothetical protein
VHRTENQALALVARCGYAARGIVYCLVGGLALLAAIDSGGQTGGSRSALATLLQQPLGRFWLGFVAAGLLAFAVWRIIEAATDADRLGTSYKALAKRAGHVVSGFVYGGLAFSAAKLALGQGGRGGGDDRSAQDWTAWALSKPLGEWAIGLVGLVVIGVGLAYLAKSWKGDVLRLLAPPARLRRWVVGIGRLGFAARGVVFVLVGAFLILAGIHSSSKEAIGLGGALKALEQQPYGWAILAVTALGLAAFGLFGLIQARYRTIGPPDAGDAKAAAMRAVSAISTT